MTAVLVTEDNLAHIKGNLRNHFGKQVKSAHLTEAIAAALGRRTHAALLTDLPLPSARLKAVLFDDGAFATRLAALGYTDLPMPDTLWETAVMNDLPKAAIKEFPDDDKRSADRWFVECERRNIPWVRVMTKRKYAKVEWDHWSLESDLDEKMRARFSEACSVVDDIFKRHRVQRSRPNPHPMVGSFEHIPMPAARQAAGEMFLLMYSLITAPLNGEDGGRQNA
jgi:hypothetical protein